jgi:hypothetical protein
MDHTDAQKLHAVEKYLLGELSPEESEDFELHFFSCTECAEDLKVAVMLTENGKALLAGQINPAEDPVADAGKQKPGPHRSRWLSDWLRFGVPAFAALLLCAITVYQNTVTIPHLREEAAAASSLDAPVSYALRAASRGAETEVVTDRSTRDILLRLDPAWDHHADTLECELTGPKGTPTLRVRERAPEPGRSVYLLVPTQSAPAGHWTLTVRDGDPGGALLAQYSFQIRYRE